ncbi:MAG: hypothetical protein HYT75_03820 [Deltaproteobacteria bacterium]|nr:hypothetical protein [Deltaproteobacteria bacterium]
MPVESTQYPRGPYRQHYFESMARLEARHHPKISFIPIAFGTASDGYERIGAGGRFSFPISKHFNLGLGYLNYPFETKRLMSGHHFETFLEVPEMLPWGEWQTGVFADFSSFDTVDETRKGGIGGIFVGLALPLYSFGKHLRIDLMLQGGLGYVMESEKIGGLFQSAAGLIWML